MAVTLPAQSSVRSGAESLRPVDLILAAYLIIVSIVAALRLPVNPGGGGSCWLTRSLGCSCF
jgi:hypothetical protein